MLVKHRLRTTDYYLKNIQKALIKTKWEIKNNGSDCLKQSFNNFKQNIEKDII